MKSGKFLKWGSILLILVSIAFIAYVCVKMFLWNDIYAGREDSKTFLQNLSEALMSPSPDGISNTSLLDSISGGGNLPQNRPFSVLLMGVDTKNLSGRSDTLMLAVVDPEQNKVSLLSIPRDTYTQIDGRSSHEKIAHAHAYGLDTAIRTVENLFDIPIDYYITININGFKDLVDALGGIDVDVEKRMTFHDRFTDKFVTLEPGRQRLSGSKALSYARFRGDAEGDFGRMRRQQQVLREIASQSTDFKNISKLSKILDILGNNVRTDIKFKDMVKILLKVHDISGQDIETIKMTSVPQMRGGVSYVVIPDNELSTIQSELDRLLSPHP